MARDYEDFSSIDDLDDDELREMVKDRLADHNGLDADDIAVEVREGRVLLSGRVGTEEEFRIADHVVTDVVGAGMLDNQVVVDAIRRAESPAAVDDHLADEEAHEGLLLGDMPVPLSPEAEHRREGLDEELFGTADVQKAIEDGTSYIPPTSPTPEGMYGTDAPPNVYGEDH